MLQLAILALITLAVLALVLAPLFRRGRMARDGREFDRAVYRDQLKELERDLARGMIVATEAESARLEIERRLLATDRDELAPAIATGRNLRAAAVLAALLAGGAAALYLAYGSPGVPDQPFAARARAESVATKGGHDLEAAAASLEAKLAKQPNDPEGWALYGRTLGVLGHWDKAVDAYRHAVALAGGQVELLAAYGEAQVLAAQGTVTPGARDTLNKVLATEPNSDVARYYLALADAQAGKVDRAIAAWQKLASEMPEGSQARDEIKQRIDEASASVGKEPPPLASSAAASRPSAASAAPGPDAEQMAAAAKMAPEDRRKMIRGMVSQLAARLRTQPNDLDGWRRLGRAYAVLGEIDESADAYDRAAKLEPTDPEDLLNEAQILLSPRSDEDPVPDRVAEIFQRVAALAPDQPMALWYLGRAAAEAGRVDEARSYWQRLLAQLPADDSERKMVTGALAALPRK